jgi:hypothetical protein
MPHPEKNEMHPRVFAVFAFVLPLLAAVPSAFADAIDGHWCHHDGRRMSIDGPAIVTPGGTSTEGDYDRHGFAYTVPEGEPGAGARVTMDLIDEDTIELYPAGQPAHSETWQRCELTM